MSSCSQCSAPMSVETAQGRAPCARCGAVNAAAANPYAPQPVAVAAAPHGAQPAVCPSCGAGNPPNIKFCRGCGQMLPPTAAQPAQQQWAMMSPAPALATHAWVCRACRKENAPQYKFCLGCGGGRSEGAEPMAQAPGYGGTRASSPARSSMWIVLLLVALFVGGAIVVGVVLVVAR